MVLSTLLLENTQICYSRIMARQHFAPQEFFTRQDIAPQDTNPQEVEPQVVDPNVVVPQENPSKKNYRSGSLDLVGYNI
jgi:hypothetical protein